MFGLSGGIGFSSGKFLLFPFVPLVYRTVVSYNAGVDVGFASALRANRLFTG